MGDEHLLLSYNERIVMLTGKKLLRPSLAEGERAICDVG